MLTSRPASSYPVCKESKQSTVEIEQEIQSWSGPRPCGPGFAARRCGWERCCGWSGLGTTHRVFSRSLAPIERNMLAITTKMTNETHHSTSCRCLLSSAPPRLDDAKRQCFLGCWNPNSCSTKKSSHAKTYWDVCGRSTVREHSSQAVPGVSGYSRNWQDATGGWSSGQSQTYVRTTRRRISTMQARVAQMLREGQGEALGERELEEDLGAFMIRLGYTDQVAQEQVEKLLRARAFVSKSQRERETLEGDTVEKELEREEEEGESEDGEEVEVSGDDGLVESTGTETRKAEEKGMSTKVNDGNVVSEVSVAVASVSEQTDFPRFAKRSKTRDFAQLPSEVSAMTKLQTSQVDPHGPASSKLQFAQLVPVEKSSSSKSGPVLAKVKRERPGRAPVIIETKPRNQRQTSRQEPVVVPPGYLVANGHKLRCLHYVGRCWRKPGRDMKWQCFGQIQPAASAYDHCCRHCWGKGQLPGGSSEPAHTAEDSGSSSTDA